MKQAILLFVCLVLPLASGCALKEVYSKTKFGPEFRSKSNGTAREVRWISAQQTLQLKWDKGISTSLTYRRRDTDEGGGDRDNGVWFEFGFPLWKAPKKPDPNARRIRLLEERVAELHARLMGESALTEQKGQVPTDAGTR